MIETVKGFRDIFPPDSLKRRKVREVIENNFKLFGFMPIETPTIEYEEVVKGTNEQDEAVSERFRLKDRGERELALRYEFTFQLKRIFKENPNIKLPFRRYEIGSVFRDEPISKDRYRGFTQCDADIIGDSSIKADAECLALGDKICKELGIKYKLKINNRKLINSILDRLEILDKANVLREIDKLSKIGEDEVKRNLTKYADKMQILDLFKLLNKDLKYLVDEKFEGAKEVEDLMKILKTYKIKAEFTPFLMRGFAYYTGTIFEAYNEKLKGSIFGGGRFDNLVGEYIKRQIPAVGISLGRILDYPDINVENVRCILISIDQDKKTTELMKNLRQNNISCFAMDKISKALDYSNSMLIPFVIFIGKDEAKQKKVKIRDMKTGKERLVSENQIMRYLKI
ncbi:MAG: histidine--tRNA ligase [Candidatus Pacearchaeota archaeon]|jgi:histidyl-tRNA synthetase